MKKRILLADNDESVRKMLRRVLESEGYDVLAACAEPKAVGTALTESPDLVLLDTGASDGEDHEILRLFDRLPSVPVILVTHREGRRTRIVKSQITAIMEKPLDLNVLLDRIRTVLVNGEPR